MTLRGMPDEICAQLRVSAVANRRSLNNAAIACLESMLLAKPTTGMERSCGTRMIVVGANLVACLHLPSKLTELPECPLLR